MAIRSDASIERNLYGIENYRSKTDMRHFLLDQWKSEEPQTKYRYFVEQLNDGTRIYLERPGRLNKGCDFVIYIENHIQYKNGNNKPPKHNDILSDLAVKKKHLLVDEYNQLLKAIDVNAIHFV